MKHGFIIIAFSLLFSGCGVTSYQPITPIVEFNVELADADWTGQDIPAGQQCKKYGGDGHSPLIKISQIPPQTQAIIIEFSDRSWFPMNHGGHGKIGIKLATGQTEVIFPSVAGESFNLPDEQMFIFHQHRGGRGEPGAYLPPCSGGRGNHYYADVKAVKNIDIDKKTADLLGEASLFLGEY